MTFGDASSERPRTSHATSYRRKMRTVCTRRERKQRFPSTSSIRKTVFLDGCCGSLA